MITYNTNLNAAYTSGVDYNKPNAVQAMENILNHESIGQRMIKHLEGTDIALIENLGFFAAATPDADGTPIVVFDADFIRDVAMDMGDEIFSLLEVTTHEMCHVQQMKEKRLIIDNDAQCFIFEGATYSSADVKPYDVSYLDLPWETEAHIAGLKEMVEIGHLASIEEGWETLKKIYSNVS